jgi:hypothetical protein
MRNSLVPIILAIVVFSAFGCQETENSPTSDKLFTAIGSDYSGVNFINHINEDINFHHLNWESVYNGAGAAAADFDGDGLEDLFFAGNQVSDRIYQNLGDFKFKDRTDQGPFEENAGWSSGVSIADVNNDGLLDIYVCRLWHSLDTKDQAKRKNVLYINKGDFEFVESAEAYRLADSGHGTQASFFDYDGDNDLDMFLLNAPSNNYSQKLEYINNNAIPYEHSDKLFRNDGGKFTDVTKSAGLEDYGFGLGVTTVDLNLDGWTDIYVANDFEIADHLWINQRNGTFKDEIQSKLKHISFSSMGTDAADANNDGFVDIAVLDMQSNDHYRSKTNMPGMDVQQFWTNVSRGQHFQYMSNMLQMNQGYGFYKEIAQLAGIASTDWSWSVLLADLDNDQYKDIFITNGLNKDIRNNDFAEEMKKFRAQGPKSIFEFSQKVGSQKIANLAFQNLEGSYQFQSKAEDWGLDFEGYSYGAAYADLDNDGDLDLIVNNNNSEASIYKNNVKDQNWIQLSITEGELPKANIQCLIYAEGKVFHAEQSRTRGFQSSVSPTIHIGLGEITKLDSIILINNLGRQKKLNGLRINKRYEIEYLPKTWTKPFVRKLPDYTWLTEITRNSNLDFRHEENEYNDFNRESLLPHMQTRKAPFISSRKEPGKQSSLIYIGNSHGAKSEMYRHANNRFYKLAGPWHQDAEAEDAGSAFFDIDNDGDLDLYVASGGSEKKDKSSVYADRLYINNDGTWSKESDLSRNAFNGTVVVSSDFDSDGDEDLFVGAHAVAGKYPFPSSCQLLINEDGILVDKIEEIAPTLKNVGMVTDAIWSDFNGDDLMDLVVIGEFMSVKFFENNGKQLIENANVLSDDPLSGWWYTIEEGDLDGDGVPEYVLGNIGLNNKYHPDKEHPLQLYGNDFDKNSTNDVVLTKTSDTYGEVPVRGRQCSSEQMPFIKSKFKDFESYAKADVLDIYGEKGLDEAVHLIANNFESGYLKKNGTRYDFVPFPSEAQVSAIRDVEIIDVNHDGLLDIVSIGNEFDAEVETTRHDASTGIVLTQNGTGEFRARSVLESGLYAPGNSRKMTKLTSKDQTVLVITNNQFVSQVIKVNK